MLYNYDQSRHAFDETLSEKETLETKIGYYKTMMKHAIQPTAVSHTISDEQIDRLFHESFHGAVVVAILSMPSKQTQFTLEEYPLPPQWLCITLDPTPEQLTILIGVPDYQETVIPMIEAYFQNIIDELHCSVSYSEFSSNPLDIARLYDMAKQAQLYGIGATITSYSSIQRFCEESPDASYPYHTFDELSVCLRQLNFQRARENVSEITQITASYPYVVIRCICMDVLTLINTAMHANSIKFEVYEALFIETLQLCRSALTPDTQKTILHNILAILVVFEQEIIRTGLQLPQVTKFVEASLRQVSACEGLWGFSERRILVRYYFAMPLYIRICFEFHILFFILMIFRSFPVRFPFVLNPNTLFIHTTL